METKLTASQWPPRFARYLQIHPTAPTLCPLLFIYLFIFYKFPVCSLRMQSEIKTQQSSLDGNKEARGVLYQDSRLEQRHLNPWKLPSED